MRDVVRLFDRGYIKIIKELRDSWKKEVAVGILEGAKGESETSIAEYAAENEFGTAKIPSRPFMAISFDENIDKITRDIKTQYKNIGIGKYTANQALSVIGLKHVKRIQNTITNRNILPKLAESTIEKKGSTKTLVDTGAMVNSVQIEVRNRTK